jgi:hypothetical protein
MRVVFVIRSADYTRFFDGVFRELCAAGHQVEVLCHNRKRRETDPEAPMPWLRRLAEQYGFQVGFSRRRRDRWRRSLFNSRRLVNYISYLQPGRRPARPGYRRLVAEQPARRGGRLTSDHPRQRRSRIPQGCQAAGNCHGRAGHELGQSDIVRGFADRA